MDKTIGFIGCGNMGRAIIKGVIEEKIFTPEQVMVTDIDRNQASYITQTYKVQHGTLQDAASQDIVFLAVKPNAMEEVLETIKSSLHPNQIIVTIAVGLGISYYKSVLGSAIRLIRVMPNTPVAVGEGATAICFQGPTYPEDVNVVQTIFDAVGKTIVVDESLMNAVSALSGSGPALVGVFIEALADGVVRHGVSRQVAYELAAQTLLGSAKQILETEIHPAALKDQVCSPAGTSIEAITALEKNGFRFAVIDAINECVKKAGTIK